MAALEPDAPITAVRVRVHTADVAEGGTDDDVYIELFDPPAEFKALLPVWGVEIDTDENDFERGAKKTYHLPSWYFQGRIVNDILRVRIHKSDDGLWGGWAFAGMTVWVNDEEISTSIDPAHPLDVVKWLEDDDRTFKNPFKRVKFVAPTLVGPGLPDAGSDEQYEVTLKAKGGRKPLTWKLLSSTGSAFTDGPKLAKPSADGTTILFTGHTASTQTNEPWSGVVRIRDAEGRATEVPLAMKTVHSLPAPTVGELVPDFGWPALAPAEPDAVQVVVNGDNFDSRELAKTTVSFPTQGGGSVAGTVVASTSKAVVVEVPARAVPGPLRVATEFGEATSGLFTAHRDGYRHRSGMNFVNRVEDGDASDGFPDTFAWERFEQTFGVCEMFICVAGHGTVPNPIATSTFLVLHDAIDNGCCHGFGLTSLQMRRGIIGTLAYPKRGLGYPLDDSLFDLADKGKPALGLSKTIQSRQLVMMSDEALSYYLEKLDDVPNVSGQLCQMDGRPALKDVKKSISNGLSNPRLIAFAKNCALWEGHVVVPYDVEPPFTSAGIEMQRIRVYDPNRPAVSVFSTDASKAAKQTKNAELSVFTVRTGDGSWSYKWNDGDTWDGIYFFTIPLSEYGHQEDWTLPGLGTLAGTIGIVLGYAGVSSEGELAQVTDREGRELFEPSGDPRTNGSTRPAGLRLVPGLAPTARRKKLVAITDSKPVTFRVRPRSGATDPFLFSFLHDGVATTVEEIEAELEIRVDPARQEVRFAPTKGAATAILSFTRRLATTGEPLRHAVRVRDLAPDRPFTVRLLADGTGMEIPTHNRELELDLEIVHTPRIGAPRTLEHDGLSVPSGRSATLLVKGVDPLAAAGLSLSLSLKGPAGVETKELGERVTGPVIDAPQRVVIKAPRPKISLPGKKANPGGAVLKGSTALKVGKTVGKVPVDLVPLKLKAPLFELPVEIAGSGSGGGPVRVRARGRYAGEASSDKGPLVLNLPAGTRPVRLVATDPSGRASFPRTVFVTVATPDDPFHSPLLLFGDDVTAQPGQTVDVSLALYTERLPVHGVTFELSSRARVSGVGREYPSFVKSGFAPDPALPSPTVRQAVGRGALTASVTVAWDAAKAIAGRVPLGTVRVALPAGTSLGSTFRIEARGLASLPEGTLAIEGIPVTIRVWGGKEPTSVSLSGPSTVVEEGQAVMNAMVQGVPSGARNVGWWIDTVSGRARVVQDAEDPTKAVLHGVRAGYVRVMAVVGTSVTEQLVRVVAPPEDQPLGRAALRNVMPALARHVAPRRLLRGFHPVP